MKNMVYIYGEEVYNKNRLSDIFIKTKNIYDASSIILTQIITRTINKEMNRMDIQKAWHSYILHLQALKKSAATIKQYTIDGRQLVTFFHQQNVFELKNDSCKMIFTKYRQHLEDHYTTEQSKNRKLASLRSFVQFAILRGWLTADMVGELLLTTLAPIQKVKRPIEILSASDLRKLAATASKWVTQTTEDEYIWLALRNYAIVQTFILYGLKPAELVQMKWSHIAWNDGLCTFRRLGHARHVPLRKEYSELLMLYKEKCERLNVATSSDVIWISQYNEKGTAITVKTVERIMHQLSKDARINVTATSIRYAVLQRQAGQLEEEIELFEHFGYARKWVAEERLQRFE